MKSKIILIEQANSKHITDTVYQTWNPVLEKALENYWTISETSKRFLCRFCHEYSLIESSELNSDKGIMNILGPDGKPTEIKSNLPLFLKILGEAVIRLDGTVNFHLTASPHTQYVTVNDSLLKLAKMSVITINKVYDTPDHFNMTNYQEVYEQIFINEAINKLVDEFSKVEDVIIYPAWHFNEIQSAEGTEPKRVVRFTGRLACIEPEVIPEIAKVPKPKFVGYWEVGGNDSIEIHLINKPKAFHRFMFNLLFGIKWIDYVEPEVIESTEQVNG